ncbi:YfhD family protein [Alkalibacillus aidingensis]|uniref:YfhD family protein n=1 Tax=Alkalibacillus aidingensis TaxID=2747607 RepID=UPI0016612C0B|nr:YfhD family protein [Alkalibacillus aidingensis]
MGRDEHKRKSRNPLAQTPDNQLSDGIDVEFAEDLADSADLEAIARSQAADERNRQHQHHKKRADDAEEL